MTRLLAGTRKGLFTLEPDGDTLRITGVDFLAVPVVSVTLDPRDGALYAGLDHGHFGPKLHRSRDGGASWHEIATPAFPAEVAAAAAAGQDREPIRGEATPPSVSLLWALEPGHAAEPGVLWCGTIPGGLFRSDDHGDSWTLVRTLWDHPARARWMGGGYDFPGIHSLLVDPRGPGRLTVGVSCGGAWRTDDGGTSWAVAARGMRATFMPPELADDPEVQDPHRIVRAPSDPEVLWCQHHCGIFRSTDGGASWDEITDAGPSTFGFAVAVHPNDADTAWFVPAAADRERVPVGGRFVVTRTRDGGRSFDVLTEGLPQEHAYHLVYRHGLDVDAAGERLAFASTTGSLWTGRTDADAFTHVTSSLPPVNVVRWV